MAGDISIECDDIDTLKVDYGSMTGTEVEVQVRETIKGSEIKGRLMFGTRTAHAKYH